MVKVTLSCASYTYQKHFQNANPRVHSGPFSASFKLHKNYPPRIFLKNPKPENTLLQTWINSKKSPLAQIRL